MSLISRPAGVLGILWLSPTVVQESHRPGIPVKECCLCISLPVCSCVVCSVAAELKFDLSLCVKRRRACDAVEQEGQQSLLTPT